MPQAHPPTAALHPGKHVPPSQSATVTPDEASTDEILFCAYQTGCERSFAILYSRYEPRLKGFLLRRIGDEALAEDLTQNIFMRICRAKEDYDPRRNFSTWAFTITNNVLKNHYRSVSRNRLQNFSDVTPGISAKGRRDTDPVFDAPSEERSPDEQAYQAEIRERLDAAVEQLEPQHRSPFVRHQLDGMNYQEVADALDIPLGTVKSRTHRARAILRDALTVFEQQ